MPFYHGKNSTVLINQYEMSQFLRNVGSTGTVEVAETTTFKKGAKTYIPGLQDGSLSMDGLFDGAAEATDEVFRTVLGSGDVEVTVVPGLLPAVGNRVTLCRAIQTSYEVSTPIGDVVGVTAEFQGDDGVFGGSLLLPGTALTTTGVTTGVDGVAASSFGYCANLHVLANTRSTATTFVVEHSTNNSTWTTLGTFTNVAIGARTSQHLRAITGTVNRYLRVSYTLPAGTGSITAYVSVARFLTQF